MQTSDEIEKQGETQAIEHLVHVRAKLILRVQAEAAEKAVKVTNGEGEVVNDQDEKR